MRGLLKFLHPQQFILSNISVYIIPIPKYYLVEIPIDRKLFDEAYGHSFTAFNRHVHLKCCGYAIYASVICKIILFSNFECFLSILLSRSAALPLFLKEKRWTYECIQTHLIVEFRMSNGVVTFWLWPNKSYNIKWPTIIEHQNSPNRIGTKKLWFIITDCDTDLHT